MVVLDFKKGKFILFVGLVFTFLGSGCMKKAVKQNIEKPPVEEVKEEVDTKKGFQVESLLGQDWKEIPELTNVQFEFDKASLTAEGRTVLQKNAKFLKDFPEVEMRVGGHCDDQGTIEYNIALGQRRARAARDYYKALGISENRLTTISFGEERPLCTAQTEECWAKNRRAETRVRVLALKSNTPAPNLNTEPKKDVKKDKKKGKKK